MASTLPGFNLDPGSSRDAPDRGRDARALKDLVRKELDLDVDAPVFVAELKCGEVDCPDVETIIALFLGDRRTECRIGKPVASITGADVASVKQDLLDG